LPNWHHKESADMLETQRKMSITTHLTQRADSGANTTSAQHATHPNR
jgi:hypothetical protein